MMFSPASFSVIYRLEIMLTIQLLIFPFASVLSNASFIDFCGMLSNAPCISRNIPKAWSPCFRAVCILFITLVMIASVEWPLLVWVY